MLNAVLLAALLHAPPQAGGAPAQPAAAPKPAAAQDAEREREIQYQLLCERYTRSENDWSDQLKRLASFPEQRAELIAKHPVKEYWAQFEAQVKDGQGHALVWLAAHADKMYSDKAEVTQKKTALFHKLIDEHASESWAKEIPQAIGVQRYWLELKGVDELLSDFAKKTQNREFAAEALARMLAMYATLSVRGEGGQQVAELSERLLRDYADTEAGRTRKEEIASLELSKLISLSAAGFTGKDVDGAELGLAALRGKFVLLVFWSAADARSPAMVQTLRELLARHAEDPFVVLGASSDADAARFREFVKAQSVSWRTVWEGAPNGPIAQSYKVQVLPSWFLIDTEGVIRQTWVGPKDLKTLDARLEPMLAPLRNKPK